MNVTSHDVIYARVCPTLSALLTAVTEIAMQPGTEQRHQHTSPFNHDATSHLDSHDQYSPVCWIMIPL